MRADIEEYIRHCDAFQLDSHLCSFWQKVVAHHIGNILKLPKMDRERRKVGARRKNKQFTGLYGQAV
jgi:hypothetical protein